MAYSFPLGGGLHASQHNLGQPDWLQPESIGAINASVIGQPNGLVPLDSTSRIALQYFPPEFSQPPVTNINESSIISLGSYVLADSWDLPDPHKTHFASSDSYKYKIYPLGNNKFLWWNGSAIVITDGFKSFVTRIPSETITGTPIFINGLLVCGRGRHPSAGLDITYSADLGLTWATSVSTIKSANSTYAKTAPVFYIPIRQCFLQIADNPSATSWNFVTIQMSPTGGFNAASLTEYSAKLTTVPANSYIQEYTTLGGNTPICVVKTSTTNKIYYLPINAGEFPNFATVWSSISLAGNSQSELIGKNNYEAIYYDETASPPKMYNSLNGGKTWSSFDVTLQDGSTINGGPQIFGTSIVLFSGSGHSHRYWTTIASGSPVSTPLTFTDADIGLNWNGYADYSIKSVMEPQSKTVFLFIGGKVLEYRRPYSLSVDPANTIVSKTISADLTLSAHYKHYLFSVTTNSRTIKLPDVSTFMGESLILRNSESSSYDVTLSGVLSSNCTQLIDSGSTYTLKIGEVLELIPDVGAWIIKSKNIYKSNTIRNINTNANITAIDEIIFVDSSSISVTVTVTSAAIKSIRHTITIKDKTGNANSNNIIIATEGAETIDGQNSITINSSYGSYSFTSDGLNLFST